MKTKILSVLSAAMLLSGATAVVAAAHPGPHHGNNDHGLCTAYFNGQKKGHDKKENPPPPFANLEQAAEDADQSVYEFCLDSGIGGNPDHGRYPECFDDDPDTGNDACPSDEE